MSECYRQSVGTNAMKEWNESTCDCRCKEKYRECSTGYEYDNIDTCRYYLTKVTQWSQITKCFFFFSCVVRYRPASHSSIVILGVALAVAIATIVYLAVRFVKKIQKYPDFQKSTNIQKLGLSLIMPLF